MYREVCHRLSSFLVPRIMTLVCFDWKKMNSERCFWIQMELNLLKKYESVCLESSNFHEGDLYYWQSVSEHIATSGDTCVLEQGIMN